MPNGIKDTTDLSVSQLGHTYECLLDIIVGAFCKMVSGRFGAKEYGNNQECQAGYHGRRVDKSQCCSVRLSFCEEEIKCEANHDAKCDPLSVLSVNGSKGKFKCIAYHSCHKRMADPRQNPTAVSPAKIGVLTALIPMPW